MTVYDRQSDQKVKMSFYPQLTKVKQGQDAIVDTLGYKAAVIYVVSGTITDGTTATFKFWGSAAANGANPVELTAANGLVANNWTVDGAPSMSAPGTVATLATESQAFAAADDNVVRRFGYVGPYRYIFVTLDSYAGAPATGGIFCAFVELLEPDVKPVLQD